MFLLQPLQTQPRSSRVIVVLEVLENCFVEPFCSLPHHTLKSACLYDSDVLSATP